MDLKERTGQPTSTDLGKHEKLRSTRQEILPVSIPRIRSEGYDMYPFYPLDSGTIRAGYKELAQWIAQQGTVRIDGYVGVFWQEIANRLLHELEELGKQVRLYHMDEYLKPESEITALTAPFLGAPDSVWGTKTNLQLADFYQMEKLSGLTIDNESAINLVLGVGAALVDWETPLIYVDLSKNELQYRMKAGSILNLGTSQPDAVQRMYKRFYFVDWVVCNAHKATVLPELDLWVDGQGIDRVTWAMGADLRRGIDALSRQVFRPRPWFSPGSWGGQWLKKHIEQLAQNEPNYAWSFEFIAPENGLVFQSDGWTLEISFDCLMYLHGRRILGKDYARFGYDFPIRFDFLDTFDGGNLSIQCHPSDTYIQREFGESFTQDETYYILDSKDGAEVYLGFQDDIEPKAFRSALEDSLALQRELDVDRYVQRFPSHKHDFFLIPNGTIHSSGKNNLVLEISATPYIFTFKMYDWLSLDLDGKPRPIAIDHAFQNLAFDRKGSRVAEELISQPIVIHHGENWKIEQLPTHPQHFYDVHRLEFSEAMDTGLEDTCELMMLVEGDQVLLRAGDQEQVFHYAETFIIPASVGQYTLQSQRGETLKVLRAFVR